MKMVWTLLQLNRLLLCILAALQGSSGRSIDQMLEYALENADPDVMDSPEPGFVRVEIDMLIKEEEYRAMIDSDEEVKKKRKKRKAINGPDKRWTNNTVYYKFFQNDFNDEDREVIAGAMRHWERHTCLSFREASADTTNYFTFFSGQGCWSYIGMQRHDKYRWVSLGSRCRTHSIVVHELGHALGFYHEQSRTDRDRYVRILEENIENGQKDNFKRLSAAEASEHGVQYDYRSVMHYGQYYFSRNGKPTIRTIDEDYQDIIGKASGLSFQDIKLANIIYKCNSHCPRKTCDGEGFVGKDCKCWCKGTTDPEKEPVIECDVTPTPLPVSPSTLAPAPVIAQDCRDTARWGCEKPDGDICTENPIYSRTGCRRTCGYC